MMQGDAAWTKDAAGLPENPDQDRAGNVFKDGVGELHVNACGREAGSGGVGRSVVVHVSSLLKLGEVPERAELVNPPIQIAIANDSAKWTAIRLRISLNLMDRIHHEIRLLIAIQVKCCVVGG